MSSLLLPLFAATKEAAYVHALSLAAIAHSVAKVCAVGDVTSCSCDTERLDLPTPDSQRQYAMGCSDNVEFGVTFATQFLHKRHLGVGPLQNIERENMHIGAQVNKRDLSIPVCLPGGQLIFLSMWGVQFGGFSLNAFPAVRYSAKPWLPSCQHAKHPLSGTIGLRINLPGSPPYTGVPGT